VLVLFALLILCVGLSLLALVLSRRGGRLQDEGVFHVAWILIGATAMVAVLAALQIGVGVAASPSERLSSMPSLFW
jgi:hypothetical protein